MTTTQTTLAHNSLENYLNIVIQKYYTENPATCAELVSWIDGNCMKGNFFRLGFYAVIGIAEECFKVYAKNKVTENYDVLLGNILNTIRRNVEAHSEMSDEQLFDLYFVKEFADN